jgi:hypothetical protein
MNIECKEDYSFMKKLFPRWSILISVNVLLLVLLTACSFNFGGATGGNSSSSSGATPTPAPASLKTFNGDGFSIGYPQDWKQESQSGGQVVFTDALGTAAFIVQVASNPNGVLPVDKALDGGLSTFKSSAKNYKDENAPATTTVGGSSWKQKAGSGDVDAKGTAVNGKIYILATNHPENTPTTKLFVIVYDAPSLTFDQANTSDFQPMLQSFKFTA